MAVSTPYPRLPTTAANAQNRVIVALTRARIDRARRAEFDRDTQHVIDAVGEQRGLLGWSVRRQLCGDTVWTLTIWENDQARTRFLDSAAHRRAVVHSGAAVLAMHTWEANVARLQIPGSWAEALAMLTDPDSAPPGPARPTGKGAASHQIDRHI